MRNIDRTLDPFNEKEKAYIKKVYKGRPRQEVLDMVVAKYGRHHNFRQLSALYSRLDIRNGLDGRFKKGHIPMNKGIPQTEYMSKEAIERTKATRFKVGDKPPNTRKIGSKRITEDGVMVKVGPNKWDYEHRVKWIKKNGPIPDGYILFHIDLDNKNNNFNNLCLVSMVERCWINRNAKLINMAKLRCKVCEVERKRK